MSTDWIAVPRYKNYCLSETIMNTNKSRIRVTASIAATLILGGLQCGLFADPTLVTASGPTSPQANTGLKVVPAIAGDKDTYTLVPETSATGVTYRLVPAKPGEQGQYKLVAPEPAANGTSQLTPSESSDAAAPQDYYLGGQNNEIVQHVFPFHSPYAGTNSFISRNETEATSTITLFFGHRFSPRLELYVNPEESRGHGLAQGYGLGSFTNGEVVRTPTLDQEFYLARYFFRYVVPTGSGSESVSQGEQQLAGSRPIHRVVFSLGKLAVSDLFDLNRYANSTRTQFMSWGLINDAAYDYAADTRGYSKGAAIEYIQPSYAIRFGAFQMPTIANYIKLSSDYRHNAGLNLEIEVHPRFMANKAGPGIVRFMYMRNYAHMGEYREAVALAAATGTTPDITAVEKVHAHKYGYYVNFEQPLADDGNTGIFGRAGYNDGATEDFAYTEADRHVSFGGQVSGVRWRRQDDIFALALMQNDLSAPHKEYLAAGGLGFLLGDGKLNYAPERTLESYYNYQLSKHGASTTLFVSPDFQFIENPGYNKDRGPVSVPSLRFHAEF